MAAEACVKFSVSCLVHRRGLKKNKPSESTLWPVWLLCHMSACIVQGLGWAGLGWGGMGWDRMGMWSGKRKGKLLFSRALTLTQSCSLWNCFQTPLLHPKSKSRESGAPQCSNRADQWEKATYCLIQIGAVWIWSKELFPMLPRIRWTSKSVTNTTDKVYSG